MPLYEYRCKRCRRKTTALVRSAAAATSPVCQHCGHTKTERLISTFAHHRSWDDSAPDWVPDEDAINEASEDPRQLVQYMRRMKKEMGEVTPEFDQMVDELESEAEHPEDEPAGEESYDEEL